MKVEIGDKFQYNSTTKDYSFEFIIFGINNTNFDIIIDRDNNPSLFKLKKSEIQKCRRLDEN